MNHKTLARILLIVIILLSGALACISGGGGGGSITPADLTATLGAQQFHAQLTAQAQQP